MASDNNKKDRVRRALENYASRDWREIQKQSGLIQKRKNSKPEKEVEKEVLPWLRQLGAQVEVYESKATYNPAAGRYISQSMKAGTCDIMGTLPDGTAIAIELKAKGKLSTFNKAKNERQRTFIKNRINSNAFACVVDSLERLIYIYTEWSKLKNSGKDAKEFLLNMLPAQVVGSDDDLFD